MAEQFELASEILTESNLGLSVVYSLAQIGPLNTIRTSVTGHSLQGVS